MEGMVSHHDNKDSSEGGRGGGEGERQEVERHGVKSGHVSSRSGRKVGWEGSEG